MKRNNPPIVLERERRVDLENLRASELRSDRHFLDQFARKSNAAIDHLRRRLLEVLSLLLRWRRPRLSLTWTIAAVGGGA